MPLLSTPTTTAQLHYGQKAKNAGKKKSKTCDKPATSKSMKFSGGKPLQTEKDFIYTMIDSEGNEKELVIHQGTKWSRFGNRCRGETSVGDTKNTKF